jgi:hypothetical protein
MLPAVMLDRTAPRGGPVITLAGWSFHAMPLEVTQEPIITETKNGGVTTPAPLTVPHQYAARRRRLQRALAATL